MTMDAYLPTAAAALATLAATPTNLGTSAGALAFLTIVKELVEHAQIKLPDTNSGLLVGTDDVKGDSLGQVLY